MSVKGNEVLRKVDNLLGAEKELLVLKGKLFSPQKALTKEGNEPYYTFKLKTLKKAGPDEYSQSFNTYYCIMPVEASKQFSETDIASMKDNEVICLCSANAQTKTLGDKGIVVNNITLYVNDIMLLRSIDKAHNHQKAINL